VTFDDAVQDLLTRCPGSRSVAIVAPDGIPVVVEPHAYEMETLGAELATIVKDMDSSGEELQHGRLQQFTVEAENAQVLLTTMTEGYFLLMVLDSDAVIGRARFACRVAGERLRSEFL
jgi:predicted regulator of Ras-like GTPase activity (Roadblock/LC7/MglB family)